MKINVNIIVLMNISFFVYLFSGCAYSTLGLGPYALAMGIECIFTYLIYIRYYKCFDPILRSISLYLLILSLFLGFTRGDVFDSLIINIEILLPLCFTVININKLETTSNWMIISIISFVLLIVVNTFSSFVEQNSNSIGFYSYTFLSLILIWFQLSKNKVFPIILIIFSLSYVFLSGTRNVIIITPIICSLLLLPLNIKKNNFFYFTIITLVFIYIIFTIPIMKMGFGNEIFNDNLNNYVSKYSDKTWGMDNRVEFYTFYLNKILNNPWYIQLFGLGLRQNHHYHNITLQSLAIYGFTGITLLYIFFLRIFWMAFQLIKNNDHFIYGISIILLGHFMLNAADLYLIGVQVPALIPLLLMGIIIYKYKNFKLNNV